MPTAHPLLDGTSIGLHPGVVAGGVAALVLAVALGLRRQGVKAAPAAGPVPGRPATVCQLVATGCLVALALTARLGSNVEPANPTTVLLVPLLWPALVLLAALGLRVWGYANPWALPGGLVAAPTAERSADARPAALAAVAWVWFLTRYAHSVPPRAAGVALTAYTLVTLAGCVAVGRRWLRDGELLGAYLGWLEQLRGLRLASWSPPRGATAVVSTLLGGLLFARWRLSGSFAELAGVVTAVPLLTVWLGGALVVAYALVRGAELLSARDARGSATSALVPAVAGVALAVGLRRSLVAAQLLPGTLGGTVAAVDLNPLGTRTTELVAVQLIAAGHLAGAVVLAERVAGRRARLPAAAVLAVSAAVAVAVVLAG